MDLTFQLIKQITNNFSKELCVGSGACGRVYKAMHNGEAIAVKKLKGNLQEIDDEEFTNDFRKLMKVKHQNIVGLIGYFYEIRHRNVERYGQVVPSEIIERVLCSAYIEGGTLSKHIDDEFRGFDWPARYRIIRGICEGLNHLHNGRSNYPIYHLDLKPDNILLDNNMMPVITSFEMPRISRDMIGTPGYMPPEFINNRRITNKYDVFSVGVIIIKIIAGPQGYTNFCKMSSPQRFIENVHEKWKISLQAMSKQVNTYTVDIIAVQRCIELAVRCVEDNLRKRPTIMELVDELNILDADMKKLSFPGQVDIQYATSVMEHILLDTSVEPIHVPLALLQHITEDFSDKRRIGRGGFGVVYEGHLQNGSVAVKRLSNAHTIDEGIFYREATILISVKHENIVRLLGYCANTECKAVPNPNLEEKIKFIFAETIERLLCFEYIKNGSLDKYLTDELSGLEWHTRYDIIEGICNGLDYLHNEKGIIHRDLKPANILVDDFMVPKITDFGISKLLYGVTHVVTRDTTMAVGYTAPEFIHRGEVSFKSDMYSLGIIITELVTGRKGDPDIKNVLRRWRQRWNKSVKYPEFGYQQVTKCIEIASRCLSHSPNKRPNARDILSMLNAIESTDVQINNAGEFPVGPIIPYPWELLEFDKLELNFPFEINKQIQCSIELTNITDDYVVFDIQKPGILEYCIEPNKCVVPARSKCIVIVTLQARKVVPYDTMCKDEFIVRCAAVNEGFTADEIHEDMFNNELHKLVDEVNLTVVVQCVASTKASSSTSNVNKYFPEYYDDMDLESERRRYYESKR